MESKFRTTFLEPALIYGGIIGIFTVIHAVVISMAAANFTTYNQIASYLIPVAGAVYGLYAYRKEYLNNVMTYGQSFLMGISMLVIAGIISLIYTSVYISFINPDFFRESEIIMEEKLIGRGIDAGMIETIMERTSRMRSLKWTLMMGLIFTIVYSSVVSLIVSAFMKKENGQPFRDVV